MPELPEVETIVNGLKVKLEGLTIEDVIVRHRTLRWPIPTNLKENLVNQPIKNISRRGKYLLFVLPNGSLIMHLGMSGSLCVVSTEKPVKKHDHIDIIISDDCILRYNDPRRFGACLWYDGSPYEHPLLSSLGPEPLTDEFSFNYLKNKLQKSKSAIKTFIMNSKMIVGVGNIYAQEALFLAKIHPLLPANVLSDKEIHALIREIKAVLQKSITKGGTTLKDFVNSDGKPGYFSQALYVYGRAGENCHKCNNVLSLIRQGQRSTVYCKECQVLPRLEAKNNTD